MQSAEISHPIFHCRDGQAAIDYLQEIASGREKRDVSALPDLILLDLKMPRLGGLETLKWIRQHEIFSPLVVLALTSSREQRDVNGAYQLHINAYLVKPNSLGDMIEMARSIRQFWLDQSHVVRPRISFSSTHNMPSS
jgi:two-component system response regulator